MDGGDDDETQFQHEKLGRQNFGDDGKHHRWMMDVAVGRRHLGVSRTPCVAAGNVPPV